MAAAPCAEGPPPVVLVPPPLVRAPDQPLSPPSPLGPTEAGPSRAPLVAPPGKPPAQSPGVAAPPSRPVSVVVQTSGGAYSYIGGVLHLDPSGEAPAFDGPAFDAAIGLEGSVLSARLAWTHAAGSTQLRTRAGQYELVLHSNALHAAFGIATPTDPVRARFAVTLGAVNVQATHRFVTSGESDLRTGAAWHGTCGLEIGGDWALGPRLRLAVLTRLLAPLASADAGRTVSGFLLAAGLEGRI